MNLCLTSPRISDALNRINRDAIPFREEGCLGLGRQNIGPLFLAKEVFASQSFVSVSPALSDSIHHIVEVGSQKKMIDIDAARVIASVENMHSSRDGAVSVYPSHAVGAMVLILETQHAIALTHQPSSKPQSATVLHRRSSKFTNARCQRRISGESLHSLNCSVTAIVGQGRCPRSNAARPAHYAMAAGDFQ